MKAKALILAGVALLVMTLDASAQRRGRGVSNSGFGVVTPFGNIGNPYPYGTGYGYNNYGYNNYGYNNYGMNRYGYNNQYGYNRFNQPTYVVPSQSSSYYTPGTVVTPQTMVVPGTVTQASDSAPATGRTGLMITELKDGPAKDAGLRRGDVILSVESQRTQSFDELRSVLKNTDKKQVNIEFIDGSNGQVQTKKVNVRDTKLGVTIEETPVNQ